MSEIDYSDHDALIRAFIPLAVRLTVKSLKLSGEVVAAPQDTEEFSEAIYALWCAAKAYDPDKGVAFITYAWCAISRRLRQFAWKKIRAKALVIYTAFDTDVDELAVTARPTDWGAIYRTHEKVMNFCQNLTPRHATILRMIAEGNSYREIGEHLGLSKQYVGECWKEIKIQLMENSRDD